jgi:hypothetical protein
MWEKKKIKKKVKINSHASSGSQGRYIKYIIFNSTNCTTKVNNHLTYCVLPSTCFGLYRPSSWRSVTKKYNCRRCRAKIQRCLLKLPKISKINKFRPRTGDEGPLGITGIAALFL